MALEARTTEDLMRIAASGGGFRLKAGARTTEDLIRIAAVARDHRASIYFSGLSARTTEDLMRIASAGQGSVIFED